MYSICEELSNIFSFMTIHILVALGVYIRLHYIMRIWYYTKCSLKRKFELDRFMDLECNRVVVATVGVDGGADWYRDGSPRNSFDDRLPWFALWRSFHLDRLFDWKVYCSFQRKKCVALPSSGGPYEAKSFTRSNRSPLAWEYLQHHVIDR